MRIVCFDLIRTGHDRSPDELAAYLRDAVLDYAGELKDDLEILVLRRTEQHRSDTAEASSDRVPDELASTCQS